MIRATMTSGQGGKKEMASERPDQRLSVRGSYRRTHSDPIAVKVGFQRKLREVSSKKLNVMKPKSAWIQVSQPRHLSETRRNVDTFSSHRALSTQNFSSILGSNQFWQVFCALVGHSRCW